MTKQQPEIDLALKYLGQFLSKKVEDLVTKLDVSAGEPEPASVPDAVVARIERAITDHTRAGTTGSASLPIRCKCGQPFNVLAHIQHVRDAVITALSEPDPAAEWWKRVTDNVR